MDRRQERGKAYRLGEAGEKKTEHHEPGPGALGGKKDAEDLFHLWLALL
jgi:hypothetical protein